MSQHDMVCDNGDGLTVRTDINAALQALVTCSSGTVEPPDTFPGMLWLDTSVMPDGVLRQRDQADTQWLPLLIPPEFRFPSADLFFGTRTVPNRFVWNDAFDGSGTDVMTLSDGGILSVTGTPSGANDVTNKAYVDTIGVPVGAVMWVAMATPPTNYIKCNGASLLRASAPALFTAIGTVFGAADASHFNVPDLRGEFIRGWDDGRGIDAARVLGSLQASAFASHSHTFSGTTSQGSTNHVHGGIPTSGVSGASQTAMQGGAANGGSTLTGASGSLHTHTYSGTTVAAGSTDTRPRNVALNACIKWQ